jgi:hypothetical protein
MVYFIQLKSLVEVDMSYYGPTKLIWGEVNIGSSSP